LQQDLSQAHFSQHGLSPPQHPSAQAAYAAAPAAKLSANTQVNNLVMTVLLFLKNEFIDPSRWLIGIESVQENSISQMQIALIGV